MAIYPTSEQIQALLAGPADRPVVMLNLLRFKPRADAPDEGLTGEEAYRRYARAMRAFVESKGGRFVWIGLHEPDQALLHTVQQRFGLHDLAIEDALAPISDRSSKSMGTHCSS